MWLLVALHACAGIDGADSATDTSSAATGLDCAEAYPVTWENWGDGFFLTYCRSCHSSTTSDRQGAPEGLDFDTLGQVRDQAFAIEDSVLIGQRMPVGGGVFPDDLTLLEDYLACGLET